MSSSEAKESAVLRVLYVILFYVLFGLADIVLLLIVLSQIVLSVFTGGPSQTIKDFGASLGIYLKQVVGYVSYASDEKPFPFSDWPAPDK